MATRRAAVVAGALICFIVGPALRAQDRPLPDATSFLAEVRKHLRTDRTLLSQYTYLERRREVRMSKLGKVELGEPQVLQVYPGLDPDDTYRRLIEVDGKPRDPKALDEEDRKHRAHVLEEAAKRQRETAGDKQKREQREAKARKEEEETLDDVMRVFTFTLVERQTRDGRPMIVVAFAPRADVIPKTDDGKLLKKLKGRAWVSETDHEVARVEFEMLEDQSFGLVLGKLFKGSTAAIERKKVNDEVWLPAEARFNGTGRALVRKFHLESVVQYSDYKKFSVDTDTNFKLPKSLY